MTDRVYAVQDHQYRYGSGPILLRTVKVLGRVVFDGEPWWHLEADVARGTTESHGGWVRRELYVEEGVLPLG